MKKNKSIVKNRKNNKLVKKFLPEDARQYALNCGKYSFGIETILEKFAKETLPKALKDTTTLTEKDFEELNKLTLTYGLETGQPLTESVEKRYRGLVIQIKKELAQEYDCKNTSEKILVDIAASSYVRIISLSKQFENCQIFEHFTNERNNYLNMLSKEIDRAHRQFISAIETLRFIKQPSMKVNIKTNNAFVGENQQFNNNKVQKDENNEAK